MPNKAAQEMLDYKKKTSPFITLEDGESIQGEIVSIKGDVEKAGFSGEPVKVLRTTLKVDVPDVGIIQKSFDNGSNKWLKETIEKDIDVGDVIKITRNGLQSKTTYSIEVMIKKDESKA